MFFIKKSRGYNPGFCLRRSACKIRDYPVDSRPDGGRDRGGFTLVEILLVTAMLAVISLTIYSTLSSGFRIWKKVHGASSDEDVVIFMQRFSSDLRNSFVFAGSGCSGDRERVEVWTLVSSPRFPRKTAGKIMYRYDHNRQELQRLQEDFSQAAGEGEETVSAVMPAIPAAQFSYYFYDQEKKEYAWSQEWQRDILPLAVRLEFELKGGQEGVHFVKTVSIPAA